MEYDLLPAAKGEADTRLYASPGSFAFGTTRHDVACVAPGSRAFVAGVSGHAFGAGGWGHGSEWERLHARRHRTRRRPGRGLRRLVHVGRDEVLRVVRRPGRRGFRRARSGLSPTRAPRRTRRRRRDPRSLLGADTARRAAPLTAGLAALAVAATVVAGVAAHNPSAASSALLQKKARRVGRLRRDAGTGGVRRRRGVRSERLRLHRRARRRRAFDAVALVSAVADGSGRVARRWRPAVVVHLDGRGEDVAPLRPPGDAEGRVREDYFDDYGESTASADGSSAADYGEAEDGGSTPAGGSDRLHFDDYDHDDDHDLEEGDYAAVDEGNEELFSRGSARAWAAARASRLVPCCTPPIADLRGRTCTAPASSPSSTLTERCYTLSTRSPRIPTRTKLWSA